MLWVGPVPTAVREEFEVKARSPDLAFLGGDRLRYAEARKILRSRHNPTASKTVVLGATLFTRAIQNNANQLAATAFAASGLSLLFWRDPSRFALLG